MQPLLENMTSLYARAFFLGERIDTKSIKQTARLVMPPLVIDVGENGCAVVFRYGVVVLFGVNETEEQSFLETMKNVVSEPFEKNEREELSIRIDSKNEDAWTPAALVLSTLTLSHIQLIADVLSKSVVLAHYEADVARGFDRIEPLAKDLEQNGKKAYPDSVILKHIGNALLIEQKMVGRAQVGDKPDVLWEKPELERLYIRLADEYEIEERQVAIERKLNLVSRTAETMNDLMHNRRSLRVEWYIVALIVIELVLSIYSLLTKP
jgi:required for meiotic nuclear division protein 1